MMQSADKMVRAKINWSNGKCYQLILLVKEKPHLWDVTNREYKNRNKREVSWEHIGKIMNYPYKEVAHKWNLLRQQFRNAYIRNNNRKPRNQFYNALMFLQPILDMQMAARTTSCYTISDDADNPASISSFNPLAFSSPIRPSNSSLENKLKRTQTTPKRRKVSKTYVKRTSLMKTACDCRCDHLMNTKEDDELELWGKSVASTLRKYPNVTAVRIAKSKVNLIMAYLEAGVLDYF